MALCICINISIFVILSFLFLLYLYPSDCHDFHDFHVLILPPPHPVSRECGDRVAGQSVTSIWCKSETSRVAFDDTRVCGANHDDADNSNHAVLCGTSWIRWKFWYLGNNDVALPILRPLIWVSSLLPFIYVYVYDSDSDSWRICFLLSSQPPPRNHPPSLRPPQIVNSAYPSPFRTIRAQSFSLDSTSERHQSI